MHACGFFILSDFHGATLAKRFVQRALITDLDSIKDRIAPNIIDILDLKCGQVLEIMSAMANENEYQNRSSLKFPCPAPGCVVKPFSSRKKQIEHSLTCEVLNTTCRQNFQRCEANYLISLLYIDEKNNKRRASEHRRTNRNTKPKDFLCPCCDNFYRANWRRSRNSILSHYCDYQYGHFCTNFDESIVVNLFKEHPLFENERFKLLHQ